MSEETGHENVGNVGLSFKMLLIFVLIWITTKIGSYKSCAKTKHPLKMQQSLWKTKFLAKVPYLTISTNTKRSRGSAPKFSSPPKLNHILLPVMINMRWKNHRNVWKTFPVISRMCHDQITRNFHLTKNLQGCFWVISLTNRRTDRIITFNL